MDPRSSPTIFPQSGTRSRLRSRTRQRSRSSSALRRPSLGSRRSLLSLSLSKLQLTPAAIEAKDREVSVPSVNATLDNSLPLDFFKQDIIGLVKTLRISKWWKRQLSALNLFVNRISGALTNSIYKIEYKDHHAATQPPALLLRVYGKNVDDIIDRDLELRILIKLSSKGIGPRLHGIFTNGRFEQFLEGFVTLNKEQIRDEVISQVLGRRMKDLHYRIELEPQDLGDLPMAWRLIYKWLDLLEKDVVPTYEDPRDIFLTDFSTFKQYIEVYRNWLFQRYDPANFSSNYKFCHNDTQYGNLLLHRSFDKHDVLVNEPPTEGTVVMSTSNKKDLHLAVIDFEYSGPNFPAFDLENHFSEWMSDYHDPDKSYWIHDEKYPTRVQKLNLLKAYVEYDFQYPSSTLKTLRPHHDFSATTAADLIQYEISKLYNECVLWRATVQIYWSLWGLIQNGPLKKVEESLGSSSEEPGVNSVYNISTGMDALSVDDNVIVEEAITSSDDDFNYLKYSQQKVAIVLGDLVSFGLIDATAIDEKYRPLLKRLDTQLLDI